MGDTRRLTNEPSEARLPELSRRELALGLGSCALAVAGAGLLPDRGRATSSEGPIRGWVDRQTASHYIRLADDRVRCDLCPLRCEIENGQRGDCGVRENQRGTLWTLAHGNPCALNIDPVEKKPFYHVLPGSKTLSVATAGCNLRCKFCLSWEASQARPEETYNYDLSPADAVSRAERYGCGSIASSYVEPVVFIEYMLEMARRCRETPLLHLMHTAAYVNRTPLEELCRVIDAACVDLKGFSEAIYRDLVGGSLRPVLDALVTLREQGIHLEVVNLLVPGKNDEPKTLRAMCRWIASELGADVPLHFYRFYPRYLLKSVPPTPVASLERARDVAREEGLHYAYIANVPEHPGKHTYCPDCGQALIERVGYITDVVGLEDGRCGQCGHTVPGIWHART